MTYTQLTETGTISRVLTDAVIEWDATHKCKPYALTDEEKAMFRVLPYQHAPAPSYDPITQGLRETLTGQAVIVDGAVVQQWEVYPLPAEVAAENIASAALALQDSIVAATQARLDTFAQTRNYDGILSACTYASSTVPKFAAEGQYAVDARDNTWATLYTLMADVQAGNWAMPTSFDDVEPLLPVLEWPL